MIGLKDLLEVWLDCDLGPACLVGHLAHDRGQLRFHYDKAWLNDPRAFALDPDLTLDTHPFFPKPELDNFGVFLDSSPHSWGQTLMKRREALQAKDQKRPAKTLYVWDFLIGVQDVTRQGAMRFRPSGTQTFLGNAAFAAPPVTKLRELEQVALQLTKKHFDDLNALRKCLTFLVAPGASLGGARPKANFTERDGSLWIGKFPAHDDDRDVGAWEFTAHQMAKRAGIDVPAAKLLRLGGKFHTFCVQRFDRIGGQRRFYASAMTQLRKDKSEGCSYLELAEFLRASGDATTVQSDLSQLFRRVVFNVAIGNRDDHLRNHGFVLSSKGWRLAPAFDVNPNVDKAEHVLKIDDQDNRPDVRTALSTAAFYGLTDAQGRHIVDEVIEVVCTWRDVAHQARISRADIELTAAAFSAHEAWCGQGSNDGN